MATPNRLLPVIAFLQRAVERTVGLRRDADGENIEARSDYYLARLDSPTDSMRFRIALQNLEQESDLMYEEHSLLPRCLALQVRVFELAEDHKLAKEIIVRKLTQAPIAKLFAAIIAQARHDGYHQVAIDFDGEVENCPAPESSSDTAVLRDEIRGKIREAGLAPAERPSTAFPITYSKDGKVWDVAMTVPANLADPLLGFTILMEAVGFATASPYFSNREMLTGSVEFHWPQSAQVHLILT